MKLFHLEFLFRGGVKKERGGVKKERRGGVKKERGGGVKKEKGGVKKERRGGARKETGGDKKERRPLFPFSSKLTTLIAPPLYLKPITMRINIPMITAMAVLFTCTPDGVIG
jgi:hypothetical protein